MSVGCKSSPRPQTPTLGEKEASILSVRPQGLCASVAALGLWGWHLEPGCPPSRDQVCSAPDLSPSPGRGTARQHRGAPTAAGGPAGGEEPGAGKGEAPPTQSGLPGWSVDGRGRGKQVGRRPWPGTRCRGATAGGREGECGTDGPVPRAGSSGRTGVKRADRAGAPAGEDERGPQQEAVGHCGPAAERVQRAPAAPPQGAHGGPGGEGAAGRGQRGGRGRAGLSGGRGLEKGAGSSREVGGRA